MAIQRTSIPLFKQFNSYGKYLLNRQKQHKIQNLVIVLFPLIFYFVLFIMSKILFWLSSQAPVPGQNLVPILDQLPGNPLIPDGILPAYLSKMNLPYKFNSNDASLKTWADRLSRKNTLLPNLGGINAYESNYTYEDLLSPEYQYNNSIIGPLKLINATTGEFRLYTKYVPIQTPAGKKITDSNFKYALADVYQSMHNNLNKLKVSFLSYIILPNVGAMTTSLLDSGGLMLILYVSHLLIPLVSSNFVIESKSGFLSLLHTSGVHPMVPYLASFIYYYILAVLASGINIVFAYCFKFEAINVVGTYSIAIIFIYPIFEISFALFLGHIFDTSFNAAIFSWLFVIFMPQALMFGAKTVSPKSNFLYYIAPFMSITYITRPYIDLGPIIKTMCIQSVLWGLFILIALSIYRILKLRATRKAGENKADTLAEYPKNVSVSVTDLHKIFKTRKSKVHALKGISFDLYKGQILGLCGFNGCGKSTTVNILAGAIPKTQGTIYIDGHLCFAPQYDVLCTDSSVSDCLKLFAGLRGLSKEETNVEVNYFLTTLKLTAFEHTIINSIPSGVHRRVSLAAACIGTKAGDVILCDEVTTGLPRFDARGVWTVLTDIKSRGASIILISHDLDEVEFLCDEVILMKLGEIMKSGNPKLLVQLPQYNYIRVSSPTPIDELASISVSSTITKDGFVYTIPGSKTLQAMTISSTHNGIFIDSIGLEDVFIDLANNFEKESEVIIETIDAPISLKSMQ